jgi:hypothetical protein
MTNATDPQRRIRESILPDPCCLTEMAFSCGAVNRAAHGEAHVRHPNDDLIWYQAGTRLRPYGYPTGFVPNIAHQHLLVLRREASRRP